MGAALMGWGWFDSFNNVLSKVVSDTTAKLTYAVQNPANFASTVSRAVAQTLHNDPISYNVVTPQQRADSKTTLGGVVSFIPAALAGVVSGEAVGAGATFLPQSVGAFIAKHPIATTAAVATAIAAPYAVASLASTAETAVQAAVQGAIPDQHVKPATPKAKAKPKRKPKRKAKTKKRAKHR
jgi:hypothetical protein